MQSGEAGLRREASGVSLCTEWTGREKRGHDEDIRNIEDEEDEEDVEEKRRRGEEKRGHGAAVKARGQSRQGAGEASLCGPKGGFVTGLEAGGHQGASIKP